MIKHVFVVMLENRSFDHMLGFSKIEGIDATTGASTAVIGLDGSEFNEAAGERFTATAPAPYIMDFDPGHGFADVVEQLAGPGVTYKAGQPYPKCVNTGFAANASAHLGRGRPPAGVSPGVVMTGYSAEQVPVITALAREFVVCDQWFSFLARSNLAKPVVCSCCHLGWSRRQPDIVTDA